MRVRIPLEREGELFQNLLIIDGARWDEPITK